MATQVVTLNLPEAGRLTSAALLYIVSPLLINLYHHAAIHIRSKKSKMQGAKAIGIPLCGEQKLDAILASRLVTTPIIFSGFLGFISWVPGVFSSTRGCDIVWRFHLAILMIHKTFIYVFVSLRVQIDAKTFELFRKWGYACLVGSLIWATLAIVFTITPTTTSALVDGWCQVQVQNIGNYIQLMGIGDIAISLFCLLAFVIPLRRMLKTIDGKNAKKTEEAVRRISFWSGIALLTNMIGVFGLILVENIGYIVQPLDQTVNMLAITMQFTPVALQSVANLYLCGMVGEPAEEVASSSGSRLASSLQDNTATGSGATSANNLTVSSGGQTEMEEVPSQDGDSTNVDSSYVGQ